MSQLILTVTLSPVLDQLADCAGFHLGQDFYVPELMMSAGGKGINVSRTLNHLAVKNVATGLIGGTTGRLMEEMLDQEHVFHAFVRGPAESRRSLTVLDSRSTKITRIIEKGPAASRRDQQRFLRKYKSLLPHCRWVVLSGRPPAGVADTFYQQLILLARRSGVKAVLDTGGKPLPAALAAAPFVIKPNLEEAETVLKKPLKNMIQLKKALQYFLGFGISVAIISLGEKGAVAGDQNGGWLAKAPRVKVRTTVGCGDAMIAGFLYRYGNDQNLAESLAMAVAAGAANCLTPQPGDVSLREVLQLRKKVTLEKLVLK